MTLDEISRAIEETYGITRSDVIAGKLKQSDLANMVKTVIQNGNGGILFFPDALTDSQNRRNRKADQNKSVKKIIQAAKDQNLSLYKFRQFIPSTEKDSVYSPRTIEKAKTIDKKLFGRIPRLMRVEKAGGRNGDFHLQGLVALREGEYPEGNYQRLHYSDVEKGTKEWIGYLSKPADGRLERDMKTNKLANLPDGTGSFGLALLGLTEWYTQSLKNRRNGVKKNPRTMWFVQ